MGEEAPSSDSEEAVAVAASPTQFDKERHVIFLEMMYHMIPNSYQSQEINLLTLAYFVISGLEILQSRHLINKDTIAKWVLSFQILPVESTEFSTGQFYGFCGSRSSQYPTNSKVRVFNHSHLASTYCALAILKTIGYDFALINKDAILSSLGNLQQKDGSFLPIHLGAETDLRFTYCAAAICSLLGDWSGMDQERAKDYIINCQSYDGGFGMSPGLESHGGGTYCAVASLSLMGLIHDDAVSNPFSYPLINIPLLLQWCLQRQSCDGGFQGRLNKPSDTCYAFWVGSVLKMIGAFHMVDEIPLAGFLVSCQSKYGGFSKFPYEHPDLYHSYYGLSAFGLLHELHSSSLLPQLGIGSFLLQ